MSLKKIENVKSEMMGLGDKKKIVTIILLFFAFGLYAQERFIKDNVSQNIMFYNICKSNYIERVKEHIKNQTVGNRFYSDYFIPPKGTELKLDVYRCEDIQYPVEGYSIYGIKKEGYFYFNDSIMYKRDCIDCYFYYDNFFLVAYNAEREKILFLSGNFFIDSIEDDFEFDINNPQTLYNYLRIKCFRYQIDDFEFVKKKGHDYLFYGNSSLYKKRYIITLNLKKKKDKIKHLHIDISPYSE